VHPHLQLRRDLKADLCCLDVGDTGLVMVGSLLEIAEVAHGYTHERSNGSSAGLQ